MKKLYVCGSFRFTRDIQRAERVLKENKIEYQASKRPDSSGILGCLKKIDEADLIYVVNPGGYVGKSVSVDIGYAWAKKKQIFTMNQIRDPPVMDLISGVLSPKALVDFVRATE